MTIKKAAENLLQAFGSKELAIKAVDEKIVEAYKHGSTAALIRLQYLDELKEIIKSMDALTKRPKPCLCCSCPECGSVFFAAALNEAYMADDKSNRELLLEIADYSSQGYNVSVKDASEFQLNYCEHLKDRSNGKNK